MTERKDVVVKVKGLSVFGEDKSKPKEKDGEHVNTSDDKKDSTEKKESTHIQTHLSLIHISEPTRPY